MNLNTLVNSVPLCGALILSNAHSSFSVTVQPSTSPSPKHTHRASGQSIQQTTVSDAVVSRVWPATSQTSPSLTTGPTRSSRSATHTPSVTQEYCGLLFSQVCYYQRLYDYHCCAHIIQLVLHSAKAFTGTSSSNAHSIPRKEGSVGDAG